MNRPPRNHYDNLGVPPNATRAEIQAAFRKLTKILHPDVTGVKSALFDAVVEAHEVLLDPVRRAAYDRLLSGPTPSTPSHAGGRPGGDPGGRGANEATAPGGGHGSARTGSAGARWTGAGAATAVWRRPPNFKDLAAAHTTRLVLRAREILSTPWRSVAGVLAFALTAGLCSLSWAHLSQALGFLPDDRPVGIRHAAVVYVDLTPPLPGPTSWWVLGFFLVFGLVLALRLGVTAEDVRPRVMVAVAQLLSLLYLAYSIGSTMTRGLEYGSGSPTLLLVRHPYLIPWVPGVVTGSLAAAYMWWSVWRTVRIARAQRAFAAALIRAKQEARWLIRQAPSRSSGQRARPAGASDAGRRRTPAIGDIWWGDVVFEESAESKDRPVLLMEVSETYARGFMFTSQDKSGNRNYHQAPAWVCPKASFLKLDRVIHLHRGALRTFEGRADPGSIRAAEASLARLRPR